MTTTIYKFAEGRLLVHEQTLLRSDYVGSGVPHRIGHLRHVEKVISVDNDYSKYGLLSPLAETRVSGAEVFVVMRRGDLQYVPSIDDVSGVPFMSGASALGYLSGITSGLNFGDEIQSGIGSLSGVVTLTTTVIGY
jgi:hypothetical protein